MNFRKHFNENIVYRKENIKGWISKGDISTLHKNTTIKELKELGV